MSAGRCYRRTCWTLIRAKRVWRTECAKVAACLVVCGAVLFSPAAYAANCSALPYTFTNGTPADANQVNSNFNNLETCANNNLAHSGANSDITSITGLTTPLAVSQGGTGNAAGQPSGLAGGALNGSYPNPSLSSTGVAAGTYSSPIVSVGADGRITTVTSGGGLQWSTATSWTVPSTVTPSTIVTLRIWGAGGGGGGAASANNAVGGGGGGGGLLEVLYTGFTPGMVLTTSIGTGGAAGTSTGGTGGTGGTTTVTYNGVVVAGSIGGSGGAGSTSASSNVAGGTPGPSGSVTPGASGLTLVTFTNNPGGWGYPGNGGTLSGRGGDGTYYHGGGHEASGTGNSGFIGGGGSGGFRTGGNNAAGGAGGAGAIMIIWSN